jgi:hypothetical protein
MKHYQKIKMNIIKKKYNYTLLQSTDTKELYVEIPPKLNEQLLIARNNKIHIDKFINQGTYAAISRIIIRTGIKAKIVYMEERDIYISQHAKEYAHAVHFEAAIKLTYELDKTNSIIPIVATADKDGNFINLATPAIITKGNAIYQSIHDMITSTFEHDDVLIINSFAPDLEENFLAEAQLLTTLVDFSKFILPKN